jgi:hypothetical protein
MCNSAYVCGLWGTIEGEAKKTKTNKHARKGGGVY